MWPQVAAVCAVAILLLSAHRAAGQETPPETITVRAQDYASTKESSTINCLMLTVVRVG